MSDPFDDGRERLLTEEQCAYLQGWLRESADLLGLKGWRVFATPFISEKSADASSYLRDNMDETWIGVGRDFLKEDPDAQRAILVHELLHCHTHRTVRLAIRLIATELGKRTEAVIEEAMSISEEQTIDRLAWAIAGWMPRVEMP